MQFIRSKDISLFYKIYEFEFDLPHYDNTDCIYTLSHQEILLGYAIVLNSSNNNEIWLQHIFVTKKYRNQGIAQFILKNILDDYKSSVLKLMVAKNNYPAIHIYKKYGFKILNITKNLVILAK